MNDTELEQVKHNADIYYNSLDCNGNKCFNDYKEAYDYFYTMQTYGELNQDEVY